MATEIGIRDWLKGRGYKDEEIDWNPSTQYVTLQGKNFIQATPQADSKTYSTADALDAALRAYRGNQLQDQTFSTLSSLQSQLNQALQKPFEYQTYKPFEYNPETDPQYQAALRTAQANAASAQNNTLAKLRSMGQGRSSYSETLAQQIGQRELGRVTDQALPQLLAQAYQRYVNEANLDFQRQRANYDAQQDTLRNLQSLIGLTSGLSQQELDNAYRADRAAAADKQARIDLAQWLTNTYGVNAVPKMDTQVAFDQVAGLTPLNMLQYQEDVRRYGEDYALRKLAQEHNMSMDQAQLALSQFNAQTSRMGANTSAANQNLSQQRYKDEKAARDYASQVYAGLSEFSSPQEALGWLQANAGDITANLGVDGYNEIVRSLGNFYGVGERTTDPTALRQRAIELAQKDARAMMPGANINALVDEYLRLLQGG